MKTLTLTLATFILVLNLFRGGPVLRLHVDSCDQAGSWLKAAREWAQRSHIPPNLGPHYGCYRI